MFEVLSWWRLWINFHVSVTDLWDPWMPPQTKGCLSGELWARGSNQREAVWRAADVTQDAVTTEGRRSLQCRRDNRRWNAVIWSFTNAEMQMEEGVILHRRHLSMSLHKGAQVIGVLPLCTFRIVCPCYARRLSGSKIKNARERKEKNPYRSINWQTHLLTCRSI